MGSCASAEEARERIGAALDAIDAAHAVLRGTSSDVVGNDFRVDVAERLETQDRTNRGLMYRFFAEIADPPDGSECEAAVREALRARLRVTPREIVRRVKLAARIRPRRSLTGPPVSPELAELAAAVEAGALGEDHIRAVCHALDVLPACVSPTHVAEAERTLVRHARKLDAGIVVKLGQRIADYLNPDGLFNNDDRARRRGLHLGPQGPDGMSRLSGVLDPETRAYFEAIEAAVRPGRHRPDGAAPDERDQRTPAQRCHDALKLGLETALASGELGTHRGHPVTVIATTTLAELDRAAHAVVDRSVPMPAPAHTGGGSRLPMRDLIRMATTAIHYSPASGRYPQACSTAAVPGPPKTHCHRRPEAHLLRARSRLHPPQLPRIGIPMRGAPFAGLGTRWPHRCGQAVLRLRLRPRRRQPGRMAHRGHRQRATRLDGRQRPTRNQPRPPPRRIVARRSRPARQRPTVSD
jgi:hypothetical protein